MRRLEYRKPRQTEKIDKHILPMTNIIFLMLIFFMIAGQITATDPFAITPSKSISTTHTKPEDGIIHLSKDGEITFQYQAMDAEELKVKVAEYLAEAPGAVLRLKADADYSAVETLFLLAELHEIGVEKISLITQLENSL